jgi:serine/threonine protein phosphatase PrpC
MIRGNLILCGNVGDSRAVLGRLTSAGWEAKPLSTDHKPELASEAARIVEHGGRIDPYKDYNGLPLGPLRIWRADRDPPVPGLAMTRSIGDKAGIDIGLIYTPEIVEHRLTHEDKFLIVASDGLWEFLSNKKVVQIVEKYW